jgi:hypothetical protein
MRWTSAACALLTTCSLTATSRAYPVKPWIAPGIRAATVALGAIRDDGHYDVPDDLVGIGASMDGELVFTESLILSLGVEYDVVLDTHPEPPNGSLATVGVSVPARLRFVGLGTPRGRFYVLVGLGYAALWDHTVQRGGAHDGSALRSTGALYELGPCYRFFLDERMALEVGLTARLEATSASNGRDYFADAGFLQSSIPVYVSLPLAL